MENSNSRSRGPRKKRVRKRNRNVTQLTQNNLYSKLNSVKMSKLNAFEGPLPLNMIFKFGYFERIPVASPAAGFAVIDYKMNTPRQPRPGQVGPPIIPPGPIGVASGWATFISAYLGCNVQTFKLRIAVNANEPGQSISFYVIFADTQPSTFITTYQQALTNSHSVRSAFHGTVGEISGMSRFSPNRQVKVAPSHILGRPINYLSDSDYNQEANVNPPSVIWASFVTYSISATTFMPNGVLLDWDTVYVSDAFGLLPAA